MIFGNENHRIHPHNAQPVMTIDNDSRPGISDQVGILERFTRESISLRLFFRF
ncbi:MAG: hypothetical protein LUQ55_00175 [Methanomassiliicoccales archaeon]|nr:hypothetical protein [Methanomassiliicoccales archaeon]